MDLRIEEKTSVKLAVQNVLDGSGQKEGQLDLVLGDISQYCDLFDQSGDDRQHYFIHCRQVDYHWKPLVTFC